MARKHACWTIDLCSLVDSSTIIALADWYVFSFWHHVKCGLQDSVSSDDEYRSSRNIAISLFRRYRNFIDRGGTDNLKVLPLTCLLCMSFQFFIFQLPVCVVCFHSQEFINAGVNAYSLGCTDEGLRKELMDMKNSGIEIDVMQSYGGSTSLKSKIISEEVSYNQLILSHRSWLSREFLLRISLYCKLVELCLCRRSWFSPLCLADS